MDRMDAVDRDEQPEPEYEPGRTAWDSLDWRAWEDAL